MSVPWAYSMGSKSERDSKQGQDSTVKQGQTPGPSPHSLCLNKMLIHPESQRKSKDELYLAKRCNLGKQRAVLREPRSSSA